MPKSVVINPFFDWGVDRPPGHEYADTVIYEAHVKGLTKTHPDIPENVRGTYAALAHPVMLEHYRRDRVTADALLPRHPVLHPSTPRHQGPRAHWCSHTIGAPAPHNPHAPSPLR